jgi:uncharacterized protein YdeI (YjbR/CyaY-like superfamily)
MNANPRVDAYIAKKADFARPILEHLRKVVHEAAPGIEETIKWGVPHFEHKGMVCGMAAFKQHCAFGFWHSKLVLGEEAGDDEAAMGNFGRITKVADLPPKKVIIGYVKKAVALNEAGVKGGMAARPKPDPDRKVPVPADLAAALKRNAKAKKTFDGFSYSNKKDYVEWITGAKREETRAKRLAQAIEWLAEGKTRHWKYQAA